MACGTPETRCTEAQTSTSVAGWKLQPGPLTGLPRNVERAVPWGQVDPAVTWLSVSLNHRLAGLGLKDAVMGQEIWKVPAWHKHPRDLHLVHGERVVP